MSGQRTHANPIWNFFLKVPAGGEAQGETCGVVLKTPTSTVTHLKKNVVTHLKKHPGKYKEYSEMHKLYSLPKKKSESKVLSSQLSVASMFKPKLQSSSIKAQEMTKKIAGFIAHGLQLYSMVEKESFEMTRCAIPEYVVLSQNTFSRTVVPNLYATKKNELKKRVRDVFENGGAEYFTLTTDGWSSRAGDSYVCVTAHMMDRDFKQHAYAFSCCQIAVVRTSVLRIPCSCV